MFFIDDHEKFTKNIKIFFNTLFSKESLDEENISLTIKLLYFVAIYSNEYAFVNEMLSILKKYFD